LGDESSGIGPQTSESGGDTSVRLWRRFRGGDRTALAQLLERHAGPMRRWAHGRLPFWARDTVNTDDIVQDVLLRTVTRLDNFEPRHDGALQAYLRQAIVHRVRDEIRRSRREPGRAAIDADAPAGSPSPEEETEALKLYETYEEALARLRADDRELITLRVELGLPYREIAEILDKPSEDAAQMAVSRALVRLAREMGRKP